MGKDQRARLTRPIRIADPGLTRGDRSNPAHGFHSVSCTQSSPACLDFVATLRSRSGSRIELLDSPAALDLREAIYRALQAVRADQPPLDADLERLNTAARGADLVPQMRRSEPEGALHLDWLMTDGPRAVLSSLARDTISLIAGPDVARVKPCANHKCERLFYDDSQGRRRRWCSMERCGNQSKLSRYRARQTPPSLT